MGILMGCKRKFNWIISLPQAEPAEARFTYIIEPSLAVAQSGSKSIQQQQNYSFIAKLTGNNTIPPVNTNATGIAKFYADAAKYNNNEVYYEISECRPKFYNAVV